jgi:hypothetical protein
MSSRLDPSGRLLILCYIRKSRKLIICNGWYTCLVPVSSDISRVPWNHIMIFSHATQYIESSTRGHEAWNNYTVFKIRGLLNRVYRHSVIQLRVVVISWTKITAFWDDVTPCDFVDGYYRFGGTCRLLFQITFILIPLQIPRISKFPKRFVSSGIHNTE